MGMLDERLDLRRTEDETAESVTARRRAMNAQYADILAPMPPSQYELGFYEREGKTPPVD